MRILVTIAITLLLLSASCLALACSCAEDPRPYDSVVASRFAEADIVAVLRVIGTDRTTVQFGASRQSGRWVVLEPEYTFKGTIFPGQRFYAPAPPRFGRTSCDTTYEKHQLVLVYTRQDAPLKLGGCSPSGMLPFGDLPLLFELAKGRS